MVLEQRHEEERNDPGAEDDEYAIGYLPKCSTDEDAFVEEED